MAFPAAVTFHILVVVITLSIRFLRPLKWSSNSASSDCSEVGRLAMNELLLAIASPTASGLDAVNLPASRPTPNLFNNPTPGPASWRSNDCCKLCIVGSSVEQIQLHSLASNNPLDSAFSPSLANLIMANEVSFVCANPLLVRPWPAVTAIAWSCQLQACKISSRLHFLAASPCMIPSIRRSGLSSA